MSLEGGREGREGGREERGEGGEGREGREGGREGKEGGKGGRLGREGGREEGGGEGREGRDNCYTYSNGTLFTLVGVVSSDVSRSSCTTSFPPCCSIFSPSHVFFQ